MPKAASRRWRTAVHVVPVVVAALVGAGAAQSPNDAAGVQKKFDRIREHQAGERRIGRRTRISELELNAYLRHSLAEDLPEGVTDPSIAIERAGRLTARATVDLSRVNGGRPSNRLDPMALLGGRAPVVVVGVVHAGGGTARVTLESTTISGVPVPPFLLQTIVSHYTRSPERPGGIALDEAFALPSGIREIQFGRGEAIVVQ